MKNILIGIIIIILLGIVGIQFVANQETEVKQIDHSHDDYSNEVEVPQNVSVVSENSYVSSNKTVFITTDGAYRYITSDGLPDHETGTFPNPGNPNTISEQNVNYRVTLNPVKNSTSRDQHLFGIALNGIVFEPGTAERYQASDGTVWNIEAFQNQFNLGLDSSSAHVQPTGLYHYHGVPFGLINEMDLSPNDDVVQVGWAADGFPIYYSTKSSYSSSWQLKSGDRGDSSSAPSGNYDGTYTQDFQYISGSGNLDECNGGYVNGGYGYFVTEEFPYVGRCLFGNADSSFQKGPGAGGPQGPQQGGRPGFPPPHRQ